MGREMGMAMVGQVEGWIAAAWGDAGGRRHHKLCSVLCTSSAAPGRAQPWGLGRSSSGCHLLSAHAWFQSEMLLQHLLQLGNVQ